MDESYSLFQFAVDNASSVERSVSLLYSHLLTHPDWILEYLHTTSHGGILYGFLLESMRSLETESDLAQFRDFLHASRIIPDRWLLKTACDTMSPAIVKTLLEIPGVLVDNWIMIYVYEVPELYAIFMEKVGTPTKDVGCSSGISNASSEG